MNNTVSTADLLIAINQIVSDANEKKALANKLASEADGMLAAADMMKNEFMSQIEEYKSKKSK